MKILHLLGDTADLGGILSVVRCLHEAGAAWGDEHVAWVHRSYQETRQPRLNYRRSRWLKGEAAPHAEFLLRAAPALLELRRMLRREPYDIVHAHTRGAFPVAVLSALAGRDVAFTNHTYASRTGLYRWAARLPRFQTVVLTPNMARHYKLAAPAPGIAIISECCRELFFNEPLRERPGQTAPAERLRLVGVGNIVRWKRWDVLLGALSRLNAAERSRLQFDHYGEAPADPDSRAFERELHEFIRRKELDSTVRFQGPTFDVMARIQAADWFVLPSTNEPCSVALIEALALGRPALVSASGGNVDIIAPDRTGLFFAPDDDEDLARQLRRLLSGGLNIAGPPRIRESVEARRPARVARQYRDLYESMARGGAGNRLGSSQSGRDVATA